MMRSNSGARWGNKFGMILLPIYYHRTNTSDPLEYLKRAKAMIDRKKRSLEASFSYKIGDSVMSTLGPKVHFFFLIFTLLRQNKCYLILFVNCSLLAF